MPSEGSDAQVRSTGPINAQTHQPIKGRKFGGGIRFGEMERDALLVGLVMTSYPSSSDLLIGNLALHQKPVGQSLANPHLYQ